MDKKRISISMRALLEEESEAVEEVTEEAAEVTAEVDTAQAE